MSKIQRLGTSSAAVVTILILVLSTAIAAVTFSSTTTANAVSAYDFQAGNIVSDANFYNSNGMSEDQIQTFLSSKVGSCSNSNCLANYHQDTPTRTWSWGTCSTYQGGSNESAARIIFKVQQACGINAKVILVTLQKEQGMITDSAPTDLEMRKAMGFACPDTGSCDSTFYGFFNQVFAAARQLAWYSNTGGSFTYLRIGQYNDILYNPNSACGAQSVYISNRATAALYYYTPYTPNAAAISAQWGIGDSCSAYGNRNFFMYWSSWFGNPLIAGAEVDIPIQAALYPSLGATQGGIICGLTGGGCKQLYANGTIYWYPTIGARKIDGGILGLWQATGSESGYLGYPVTDAVWLTANGGGWSQAFLNGVIHWSNAGAGRAISGVVYQQYLAQGGLSSSLGWATSDQYSIAGGVRQDFEYGSIFFTQQAGTVTLSGGLWQTYTALGAQAMTILGAPIANAYYRTDSGGGWVQSFQNGDLYWRGGTGWAMYGGIRLSYLAQGGVTSMGWPTSIQMCGLNPNGCKQEFQNGSIFWSPATGAVRVDGGLLIGYTALSAQAGVLGYPRAGAAYFSNNGGGWGQSFENGGLYWTGQYGAVSVYGGILLEYNRQGGHTSTLGWPKSEAVCGLANNGCKQEFQYGSIFWSPATGAVRIDGGLNIGYTALGAQSGALGYPKSVASYSAGNGGGWAQVFENGNLYWTGSYGAVSVQNDILLEYKRQGGQAGSLGWPKSEAVCGLANNGCKQEFQNGSIFWSPATGAVRVDGGLLIGYTALSAQAGVLGYPRAGAAYFSNNGGGWGQSFENGGLYWTGQYGAVSVYGGILLEYNRQGGHTSTLGWPKSEAVCGLANNGCKQEFQYGSIFWSPATGAVRIDGGLLEAWLSMGGESGSLGYPVSQATPRPAGGWYQQFEHGRLAWYQGVGFIE